MAKGGDPFVVMRGVERTFRMGEVPVHVLRGVDLDLHPGTLSVLFGPSGSGKSTLLNLIGGLDRPDAGTITVGGVDLHTATDRELTRYRRETVGFVFQFYNLVPTLTAIENVMVSTELAEQPLDPMETLHLVGLADRVDHFPAQLSGGEQQRVAIARALASDPDLLLCDEPTGALDRETGRTILGVLDRVTEELGKTVILVTHNSAIATIADRVVKLGNGVIESVTDQDTPVPAAEVTW